MARFVLASCTARIDDTTLLVGLSRLAALGPIDLQVSPLGTHAVGALSRCVTVRVAPPSRTPDGTWSAHVTFADRNHEKLFPTFEGVLDVRSATANTRVVATLSGHAVPPLGTVGALLDHASGRLADRTVEEVLAGLCDLAKAAPTASAPLDAAVGGG